MQPVPALRPNDRSRLSSLLRTQLTLVRASDVRVARRRMVASLAADQNGVLSRRQLYAIGLTRSEVRCELRAARWKRHGRQSICVHTGDLSEPATWWCAIFEVGSSAALDGVTALRAAGMTGYDDIVHVACPKSARPRHPRGVRVHETRRWNAADVVGRGIPRVRPAVAAVHGSLWARTDRQAALILAMAVQQRLCRPEDLAEALGPILRHRRRKLITTVISDLVDGAQALSELDFAGLCRRRGLPAPSRQAVVQRPGGRYYLDACWEEWRLAVEIDGVHHESVQASIPDALRQNTVTIGGLRVLRIPVLGLRVAPEAFLDQVEDVLLSAGWTPTRPQRPKNRGQSAALRRTLGEAGA